MRRNIHFEKILDVDEKKALDVVLNFKDYSDFIPGCSDSKLLKREFPKETGRLLKTFKKRVSKRDRKTRI